MRQFDQTVLREQIVHASEFVRAKLCEYGQQDCRFTLKIEVQGSADKRDATLKFKMDTSSNYNSGVESPWLDAAVDELMRRCGFDRTHQAQLLTYDAEAAAELERLQQPVRVPGA